MLTADSRDNLKTKIQKWGNSLALRIPRALAADEMAAAEDIGFVHLGEQPCPRGAGLPGGHGVFGLLDGVAEMDL